MFEEDAEETSATKEEAPATAEASSFRAFTAEDWKRIEMVSPATRRVGQMMQAEAERLVAGRPIDERHMGSVDRAIYEELAQAFGLSVSFKLTASAAPERLARSGGKHKSTNHSRGKNVRDQAVAKLLQQDQARIATAKGMFPRWEATGARWEAFLVSFRLWLGSPGGDLLDKLVSVRNLLDLLRRTEELPDGILEDLEQHRADLTAGGVTFTDVLRLVARDESALVNPSFAGGWAALRLYPEQHEVARLVLSTLRARLAARRRARNEGVEVAGGLLVRFCTPPSTGKSSAAAYIGAILQQFRNREVEGVRGEGGRLEPCYVLYSCYSDSVRYDVAKTCVAASVPFAIVTQDVACPSFFCFHGKPRKLLPAPPSRGLERVAHSIKILNMCDIRPVVLVMDTTSAINFLRFRLHSHAASTGDVLLFDEPTASTGAASLQRRHAELLALAPPITVLMSATLPSFEALPRTLARLRKRLGEPLDCADVASERIVSPCTVVDGARNVFGLHRLVTGTPATLLSALHGRLHLQRLFSPRATLQLLDDVGEEAHEVHSYLASLAPHDACTFADIRKTAFQILRCLPAECTFPLLPSGEAEGIEERYQLPRVVEMATSSAHLFPGTSIILSEQEDIFWETALPPLHEGALRLHKRRAFIESALAKQDKMRLHVEGKRKDKSTSERVEGGGAKKSKERDSQLDRQREQDLLVAEAEVPEIWRSEHCINTSLHAQRFKAQLAPVHCKSVPRVQSDVLDSCHHDLLEGLLSGICTLHSRYANKTFLLAALSMAESQGVFTYVSGGRSAIYGVNLPCDRVIIDLDAETTDIASLIQCLGRCGRTGKFTQSEVVFSSHAMLMRLCASAVETKVISDAPEELDRLAAAVGTNVDLSA